jgi:Cobalamin biosynthesis protein CobD/CbiB
MTLFLGMILDAIFGEPKWLWSRYPHPAVLMGRLIGWCDLRLTQAPRGGTKASPCWQGWSSAQGFWA